MSARLAADFRTDLEDSRQAFGLSLQRGATDDAVEIAIGASYLWRNAMGCTEGHTWVAELLDRELSPHDQLWAHILRADVGQGRGDHHQMFGAASAATGLVDVTDDPAGACLAAHYDALAHLTDARQAKSHLTTALDLAHESGDLRLVTLIQAFLAVAGLAAGQHDQVRAALTELDRAASEDGYDRFIVHWAGWMLGLAERDAGAARRWMSQQQDYLDRTGIVETWITSFSTAMCDAAEAVDGTDGTDGTDVRTRLASTLAHTLVLADREGYDADADCVLVLAYAEMCAGRLDTAAELLGTAVHGRFNTTAHYVLYRTVLDAPLRQQIDTVALTDAMARGRTRTPAQALAEYGLTRGKRQPSSTEPPSSGRRVPGC
jgi:hypothetical protein